MVSESQIRAAFELWLMEYEAHPGGFSSEGRSGETLADTFLHYLAKQPPEGELP